MLTRKDNVSKILPILFLRLFDFIANLRSAASQLLCRLEQCVVAITPTSGLCFHRLTNGTISYGCSRKCGHRRKSATQILKQLKQKGLHRVGARCYRVESASHQLSPYVSFSLRK